ncbi:hypothetical protein CEUSTIGMA_g13049.t1 [Chlamydomonas eustigma]|uniref:EGF-like domain-containing protein n=1 Tax=Chlamydomonas eustigma TaxID=1157962 RepID=A0A250XRF0_9CHLO|nr:hypothetical protein CEUSTIGMA_g13049.t1 [Chlamydomonas eustigma]|eukprot:GAX85634.1 hypothetical protein CEUSTIGMA_g13049.t1 [Chlamydomonas eustigma]
MTTRQIVSSILTLYYVASNAFDADRAERLCELTLGQWCNSYHNQTYLEVTLPNSANKGNRGSKSCPSNCNEAGTCNHVTGNCTCQAGWSGPDCKTQQKRECANMGPDKRDLGWHGSSTWYWSRCSGICDDDIGMCYCPPETKYGHIPAPEGSLPGSTPLRLGRPLYNCNPKEDAEGKKVPWGANPYKDIFGPKGWCEAEESDFQCPCRIDGVFGFYCNITVEHSCLNQCSGHGECIYGYCKCHDGYFGYECGQLREGMKESPGLEASLRPWIQDHVLEAPASKDPSTVKRRRPLIYVYELPTEFNSLLLQYRVERGFCMYKGFMPGNRTDWTGATYSVESVLHESFLLSPHRTLDPDEADFFYVPVYSACIFDLWMKTPKPRWPDVPGASDGPRPMIAHNMMEAARQWVSSTFPRHWDRRGGKDHIWLMAHDEGACYAPGSVWPGIILSHWGRLDFPHTSLSGFEPDNYSRDIVKQPWQPDGWINTSSKAHPCFDPTKDMVIPSFKSPFHIKDSPFLNAKPKERSIFLFFMGDVGRERTERGDNACRYSRCIRQTIDRLAQEGNWRKRFGVMYGARGDVKGDYSDLMSRSLFCLHLPGDGWSSRFEEAILHGCIPVIIMDNVSVPFEGVLDTDTFSIRITQANLRNLLTLLKGYSGHQIRAMQERITRVWHRYRYNSIAFARSNAKAIESQNLKERSHMEKDVAKSAGSEMLHEHEDAVTTIMQWLTSKMMT